MTTLTIFALLILAVFVVWSAVAVYHYNKCPKRGFLSAYGDAFDSIMNVVSFTLLFAAVIAVLWFLAIWIKPIL